MKYYVSGVFFLLNIVLLAEEVPSEQILATRNVIRKYITYTLPIPVTSAANDPQNTPHYRLMTELLKNNPDIVTAKLIISQSPREQIDDGLLFSPLMACAALGHNAILDLLLAKEVDVNQINRRQQSALMFGAMTNNTQGIIKLINAGAHLDLKDNQQGIAEDYAKIYKHPHCIKIIQDAALVQRMQTFNALKQTHYL